jgi:hypothetical protein
MTIEITVTFAINKRVEVPVELAPDAKFEYPDRKRFEEWVGDQADEMCGEQDWNSIPDCWVSTEALETENWQEVYSVS